MTNGIDKYCSGAILRPLWRFGFDQGLQEWKEGSYR